MTSIDSRRARWSTQRWFGSVLIVMVVLVLAATVVGAQALTRTGAVSNRLNDRISPAGTAVVELDAALREQESAVRGHLLSGSSDFLADYQRSVTAEQNVTGRLRGLLDDDPAWLADLTAVERSAAQWRDSVAGPLLDQRRQGRDFSPAQAAGRARATFSTVRAGIDALDSRLVAARQAGRADLDASRRVRDIVFLALVTALLLFITAIAVLLRVTVLRPLGQLRTAVRQVAGGDFDHELSPRGPDDVAELGRDVEAMRRRLVDALTASQQARNELEQRQIELSRSNADLEQFAYVASHDLQEPLRKVASFCQMLQRRYGDSLDDRARQYIGFAVDGATRMQRLINDLLTFSRIGRVHDSRQPVDLAAVLDQVEQSLAMTIDESGAEIVRPRMPTVTGDVTLLTMLWQNLIGNAIKFRHPQRPPRVEITAEARDGMWTFTVGDNGIGIDPEFADKVFVIFQRLHTRDSYTGTGIGLAVCKKVVEHHGGSIAVDTTYRDGARLVFTLAAATAPEPGGPAASAPVASAGHERTADRVR
ncbi:ATP-binding protein [Actinoplanes sp. NPDC023936]|uniref:sensor histidine kinase n=1 Tax=Actinoplanes sp. NPDC023936 TaxID=3154910 RepID=UPI0033F58EF2